MAGENPAIEVMSKMRTDPTYADLTIKVGKETVFAHRCVVAVRCEAILPMPDFNDPKVRKKLKDKSTVVLKNGPSASIMNHVLEFVYAGNVNFGGMSPNDILLLNKAAREFVLGRLSFLCEDYLKNATTMDNIFEVLKAANALKEDSVKQTCLDFAVEHYNDIVTNKDGIHKLGIDLFQEVVTAFQTKGGGSSSSPSVVAPASTLMQDLRRLHDEMPFSDLKVLVGGEEIPCHKSVLGAASEIFKLSFKDAGPSGFRLKGLSAEAFKQMVRFIYYGDASVDPLPACELVGFCRRNELNPLLLVCEDKIRHSVAVDTVLGILDVAYSPDMAAKQELVEELKAKSWPFLIEHYTEIHLQPLLSMNPKISQDMLLKIQEYQRSRV